MNIHQFLMNAATCLALVAFSPMSQGQSQLEVEAASRVAASKAKGKQAMFESLEYLTISNIRKMETVGEIETKFVAQFVILARKAAMISDSQSDYVDRFNAMAEISARGMGMESSPVAIPADLKTISRNELMNYHGRFLSMRKIPETVVRFIGGWAYGKWPGRTDMQQFEINRQSEDWCRYQNFAQNRDPVIQGLVKMGEERWDKNYSMIVHHVETRYESYRRGQACPWEMEYINREVLTQSADTSPDSNWNGKGMPPGMQRK